MMYVEFDLGETRHVKIEIVSCKGEPFEILSASYTLTARGDTEPESQVASVIMDHLIDQVITPQKRGIYILAVTYRIADETLIDKVEVRVK